MKRQISILLLIAMLAGTAISCGESGTPSETTGGDNVTTPEVTTELTDGLPDKNMEEFELSILGDGGLTNTWITVQLDAESETGEKINDAIYKRNRAMEERFNCKIVVSTNGWYNTVKNYGTFVMSGDNVYDIIMVQATDSMTVIDYLADFNNVPHVRLDKEWWNPLASSIYAMGGKQTAAAGNFSLSYASAANCLLFNKRLYDEMNVGENMYDLVREGKWTFDKFVEIAKKAVNDVDGNTVMDANDTYGYAGVIKSIHHQFVIGAGLHYVDSDPEGYPSFNVAEDEKFIGLFEKFVNLYNENPNIYFWPADVNDDNCRPQFAKGSVLFCNAWPHNVGTLREMKDDFGILPSPKYDEAQEIYYSNMANGEVTTLPRSFQEDRLENIGILLEAMSFYTNQEIYPVYKEVVVDTQYTRDDDSIEMLDIIFANVVYDFGVNIWQSNVGNRIMTDIVIPKSDAIVSTLTTIQTELVEKIDLLRESVEAMP